MPLVAGVVGIGVLLSLSLMLMVVIGVAIIVISKVSSLSRLVVVLLVRGMQLLGGLLHAGGMMA